jgi:hypothetical protein
MGIWDDVPTDSVALNPSIGIVNKESDGTWYWTYRPSIAHQQLEVTITAVDEDGGETTIQFTLTALVNVVSSRVYYANSSFAAEGVSGAIDTNKFLATGGEFSRPLTYDNLINTSQGINGVVLDIAGLPSEILDAQDFVFRMSPTGFFDSTQQTPNQWSDAPTPVQIMVQPGTVNSPARVRLEWEDHAIENRWLQIQVLANDRTGLRDKRTYYLGHLLGETTGLTPQGNYIVQVADVAKIRTEVGTTASVSNVYDITKNGIVQIGDITVFRPRVGSLMLSNAIIPPSGSPGEGEGEGAFLRSLENLMRELVVAKPPIVAQHPPTGQNGEVIAPCIVESLDQKWPRRSIDAIGKRFTTLYQGVTRMRLRGAVEATE